MAEMAPQNWVGVTSVQGGGLLRIHSVVTEEADGEVIKYYRKTNQGKTVQVNGIVAMMNAEINPVETNWELVRVLHEGNWVCSIYRVKDTEMKKLMEIFADVLTGSPKSPRMTDQTIDKLHQIL